MLIKKEIPALIALFCFFLLLFQTVGCKKNYYTPETIQGENESEIPLPENNSVSDSCADVTGLAFSSVSYLTNPQYPNGYSVCQDECIDLDTDYGTWTSYEIKKGNEWCKLNNNQNIKCCAYCPKETHYCPISKSCISDSTIEQGLQYKLECPYITLSWDKDEKAISYEIIPFYDGDKDGTEDGKCEEDVSNTKERYFYYNLKSSDCAAYYTGNVKFQIIPQYSDGLSIESYNTEWIDVSECELGLNMKSCNNNYIDLNIIPHGSCSSSKPYFCYDGIFIKDCSKCGCPTGWTCWENVPTGSVCNPKWLYNYNEFEVPNDEGFLKLLEDPYYDEPGLILSWMKENFEYEKHPDFEGTYSPYEMYIKKKGVCKDMATFAAYVLHYHRYDSYIMFISWKGGNAHVLPVYKDEEGYGFFSQNNKFYYKGYNSFEEVAKAESWWNNKKDINYYKVWNYDGLLAEEPVYKGKDYSNEYEDFSKYEWV